MANYNAKTEVAELVNFYNQNGEKTTSAYEAFRWMEDSIKVYIEFRMKEDSSKNGAVKELLFRYGKPIVVKMTNKKKIELSNTKTTMKPISSDPLMFCIDPADDVSTVGVLFKDNYSYWLKKWFNEGRKVHAIYYEVANDGSKSKCRLENIKNFDFNALTFENERGFRVFIIR